jgi:predicted SprT family Zn-dependent metalloprotease
MLTTNPDELAKLYERLEAVKTEMGENYRLHPKHFVKRREPQNDFTGNHYLPDYNLEFSPSLLISIEDI